MRMRVCCACAGIAGMFVYTSISQWYVIATPIEAIESFSMENRNVLQPIVCLTFVLAL